MPEDELLSGVFDAIGAEEHEDPKTPEKTETPVKTPKSEPKTEKQTDVEQEPDDDEEVDTQDFSRKPYNTDQEETQPEPLKKTKTETETETETPDADTTLDQEFTQSLPPELPPFALEAPKMDAEGRITNMTAEQYARYGVELAKYEMRQETRVSAIENKALDYAERILPEIKTNPAVRQMVENARVASILTGKQMSAFDAAKLVKQAIGLSTDKIAQARAEGVRSAKTSITVQKRAAVETTGATQKKPEKSAMQKLNSRLRKGDDNAFVELMDIWQSEGKI